MRVLCIQCFENVNAVETVHSIALLAIPRARAVVSSLLEEQKSITGELLDESWKQAANTATCNETPEYYRISFDNRAVGKTLYILLTSAGKYLRANFDGQFADLIFSPYPVPSCA